MSHYFLIREYVDGPLHIVAEGNGLVAALCGKALGPEAAKVDNVADMISNTECLPCKRKLNRIRRAAR